MMDRVFFFDHQDEFWHWLAAHHNRTSEVWLGYFRKSTGRNSLTWSDSVDVALCYGWIDGIRKTIDDQSYKIRFTPRKTHSVWSAVNVKKVKELIQCGKMKPQGMHCFNQRTDKQGYSAQQRNVPLAKVYQEKLKANPSVWLFFSALAPSYKRDSIWWVMSARKEETRLKRFNILMTSCESGIKIPMLQKK